MTTLAIALTTALQDLSILGRGRQYCWSGCSADFRAEIVVASATNATTTVVAANISGPAGVWFLPGDASVAGKYVLTSGSKGQIWVQDDDAGSLAVVLTTSLQDVSALTEGREVFLGGATSGLVVAIEIASSTGASTFTEIARLTPKQQSVPLSNDSSIAMRYRVVEGAVGPNTKVWICAALEASGGESSEALAFLTIAALEAFPGPSGVVFTDVNEVGASYLWRPGATDTVDHLNVLGSTGGAAGRWFLQGGAVTLSPQGGSTDDAAYITTIASRNAGKVTLNLAQGTYAFKTPCQLVSFTKLRAVGDVIINSTIANDANPNSAAFLTLPTTILAGTPNATASAGTFSTGSTTSFPSPGATMIFQSTNQHMDVVKTLAKSGSGPFAYNVDKPLSNTYLSTDTLAQITQPEGIEIDLANGVIQGTGTRFFEFVSARRCVLKNANLKPTANMDLLASFDTGSIECGYENVNVFVAAGITVLGALAFESGERCYARNCNVFGSNTSTVAAGISLYDCVNCDVDACSAYGCVNGLSLGADGDTVGCLDCTVRGGAYNGNATGVGITGGSSRNTLLGVTTQYNGYGVAISSDASTCSENALVGGKSTGNFVGATNAGIYLFTGAKNTRIDSYDLSGNGHSNVTGSALITNEDVTITNLISKSGATGNGLAGSGNGGGLIVFQSSCAVTLDGFDLVSDPGTAVNCLVVPAGSTLKASNGTLRIGHSCNGINQSGLCHLSEVTVKPAVSSLGENAVVVAAGSTRIAGSCNLDACATSIYDNTTGAAYTGITNSLCNWGQVTMNGATNVDVNYADVRTGELPILLDKADGGTPSAFVYLVSVTPGSKFTVKSAALNTSTLWWRLP